MAKRFYHQRGFPTPDDIPEVRGCRQFSIPSDPVWFGLLMGALIPLTVSENWYAWGEMSEEEAAAAWQDIFDAAYESACTAPAEVEAPFWDTDADVDDDATATDQTWYGQVDDPAEIPTELTFVENVEIWTFAGLVAVAATPGAAISFLTIAPRFVLAFKQQNLGKVVRAFVDASRVGQFTDDGSGSIKEMTIVGDSTLDHHQLYITVGNS